MITAIILTFDEARHIERCVRSISPHVERIVVVDSHSTDGTLELAKSLGADVFQNAWVNHATQFNWALDHTGIQTPWIFRLDADEVATPELMAMMQEFCASAKEEIGGFTVNRQIHFLGRWIRHGTIYPHRILRLFRNGRGRCEQRWMDEHILVDGEVSHLDADIIDANLNDLTWWTAKHNGYASREVIDILMNNSNAGVDTAEGMNRQARIRRWLKESVYGRLPLGLRPALFFFYRYILRLGFLDGWQGLVFHGLQGFWYRFLVDAKLAEIRALMRKEQLSPPEAIEAMYGFRV